MSAETRDRQVLAAIGVLSVASILYSVVIVQRLLAGIRVVTTLVVLYLLWRFVRAVERIAGALEADGSGGDVAPSGGSTDQPGGEGRQTAGSTSEAG